ncbi:GNAT family N-acetyltransferase [Shewanella sp. Scap07]|uniref:GNAT family N-acetyltransferase n=1 Tax=Shewanella sp. Scap07 TaxID=2589987 RepID=UPI0015BF89D8|nr:GNAT family N-acetyltransferase [Shewanella sp. Scap07]QLE84333.1 GNAT family N-acetyltransferase [Shewanella sp. Scap07]
MITIRAAIAADAAAIAQLEQQHINAELGQSAVAMTGQSFSLAQIEQLINQHWVAVAQSKAEIVGYVIAGRWSFYQQWPLYQFLQRKVSDYQIDGRTLSAKNSCQYGPIWISQHFRQQGIFTQLVAQLLSQLPRDIHSVVTFIAEDNQASFNAHTYGAKMQVLDYFDFDDRDYYLLGCQAR